MKNNTRLISAILAAVLCGASLAACANNPTPPVTDVTTDTPSTVEPITTVTTDVPATEAPATDTSSETAQTTDAPATDTPAVPTDAPVITEEPIVTTAAPVTTETPVGDERQTFEITSVKVSSDMKSFSLLNVRLADNTWDASSESEYKGTIYLNIDPTYSYNLDYVYLKEGDAFLGICFRGQNNGAESIWLAPEPTYSPFRIRYTSDSSDAIIEYTVTSTGEESFDVMTMAPGGYLSCYRYPNEAGNKYLGFSHTVKKSQGADKGGRNEIFRTYLVLTSEKYSQFTVYGGAVYPLEMRNFPGCPDTVETYSVDITRYVNSENGEIIAGPPPYTGVTARYSSSGLLDRFASLGICARVTSFHFSPSYLSLPLTDTELDSTVFYTKNGVASIGTDTVRALAARLLEGVTEITETPASASNRYASISFKKTVDARYDVRYTVCTAIYLIPLDQYHFALHVTHSYSDVGITIAGMECRVSGWNVISRNYCK